MKYHQMTEELIRIMKEAGEMMRTIPFTDITSKGDIANVVTDMDVKVQQFLMDELLKILPESNFLVEEEETHTLLSGYVWVIDPIDGTCNYTYDYHHSAISVALLRDKKAVLAAVYNPYLDECFHAVCAQGAYCNHKRIHVSNHDMKSSLLLCGTTPYEKEYAGQTFTIMKELFLQAKDIRRSGSAVLDLCYVAAGRVDGFYEYRLSPWDYAAGCLLIEEAGGIVDALHGEFGYTKRIGILAGNRRNIDDLRTIISEFS